MNQDDVLRAYNKHKAIKPTALELGCSTDVVRKWLITLGVIDSPLIRRIRELRLVGMPQKDIAAHLGISAACVGKNSPYEKGTYLNDNKTKNALAIQKCRKRKREQEK